MATSKHFPVQSYSPRSDSEDYPYNSVTSFKSYQPCKNVSPQQSDHTTAVSLPKHGSTTKAVKHPGIFDGDSSDSPKEVFIDNTVVSAYTNDKSRVVHSKPRVSHNLQLPLTTPSLETNSEVSVAQVNHPVDDLDREFRECFEFRKTKFGEENVGHINSLTNSKQEKIQAESIQHLLSLHEPFNREDDSSTPKSDYSDSGRNSAGSRRQLPKVPVRHSRHLNENISKHISLDKLISEQNDVQSGTSTLNKPKKQPCVIPNSVLVLNSSKTGNSDNNFILNESAHSNLNNDELNLPRNLQKSVDNGDLSRSVEGEKLVDIAAVAAKGAETSSAVDKVVKRRTEGEKLVDVVVAEAKGAETSPAVDKVVKRRAEGEKLVDVVVAEAKGAETSPAVDKVVKRRAEGEKFVDVVVAEAKGAETSPAVEKVVKRRAKPRVRDKKRSQSLGGDSKGNVIMEGNFNVPKKTDILKSVENSANEMHSSHCNLSSLGPEGRLDINLTGNAKKDINIEITGDLAQEFPAVSHRNLKTGDLDISVPKRSLNLASARTKSMHESKSNSNKTENSLGKNLINSYGSYTVEDALNDITDAASVTMVKMLPENIFFNFNQDAIQALTDSVMEKTKIIKLHGVENDHVSNLEDKGGDSATQSEDISGLNLSKLKVSKENIEGVTRSGKNRGEKQQMKQTTSQNFERNVTCKRTELETKTALVGDKGKANTDSTELKIVNQKVTPQKEKVERSPSYRKKVMARAKSRYKKSSMMKECSCTRSETGEIQVCQFCENYDNMKRRSRSSLGLNNSGIENNVLNFNKNDNRELGYDGRAHPRHAFTAADLPPHPSSKSPRPIRKVQVSSRVDVLLNSDLFRKHLKKHEDLIEKHKMLYRRDGMRKSVSNLDLSEGFMADYDSQCENESVTSEVNQDIDLESDALNQSWDLSVRKEHSRRNSISSSYESAGVPESASVPKSASLSENKNKRKHFRTLPTTAGKSRAGIPSFTSTQSKVPLSRSNIPSFTEYKKNLKEVSRSTETLDKLETSLENKNSHTALNEPQDSQPKDIQSKYIPNEPKDNKNDSILTDNISHTDLQACNKRNQNEALGCERSRTEQSIPLQLQVIKESVSRENLILSPSQSTDSLDLSESTAKSKQNDSSYMENVTNIDVAHFSESKQDMQSESIVQKLHENKASVVLKFSVNVEDVDGKVKEDEMNKCDVVQQSACAPSAGKERVRLRLKSRTLSNLELDSEYQSDTGGVGPRCHSAQSHRERKQLGTKRPRSLISKKSSLASLIQYSENQSKNSDGESTSDSIKLRPKLKAGHTMSRSKSDSKYEQEKGRSHDRNTSIAVGDKGKNMVSFDLEDTSQCSPLDIEDSEASTSIAESFSDSIRSEVNVEDNFKLPNDSDDSRKLLHDMSDVEGDDDSLAKQLKDDTMSQVLRSTSDACEITPEAARKRRERKERPYKSDPFSGTEIIPASKRCALKEERAKLHQHLDFTNSSKQEILTFLDEVSQGDLEPYDSVASLEELNEDDEQLKLLAEGKLEPLKGLRKHNSNVSSLSTDSGVIGQDGSHDSQQSSPSNTLSHSQSDVQISSWQHTQDKRRLQSASCADFIQHKIQDCADCSPSEMIDICPNQICQQCIKRRIERKETIQEIIDTEMNYGRDLNILKEEFYKPMLKTNLLSKDQLDAIFLNLDELIHVNKHFISKMKSAICSASQNNDTDLESVMIGCLFLESSTMFLTFENYCVNQAQAPILLEQLERDKELLRVFLTVSQNDNQQLRRMHLKSFLMVPVQRIMKYPLFLDRLYKTTPRNHPDKSSLKEAKEKIEDILGHINSKSRTTSFRQRKPSQKSPQHCTVNEKIEVTRVALETLQWNRKDVCDVITSHLQVTQPLDHLWATKRCKNYKFSSVFGVLMTLMQLNEKIDENENTTQTCLANNNSNNENVSSRVQSAAVVLIKEKNGRFQVMREPFMLEKCVVSQDPEFPEVFEILEWSKEAYLVKADTPHETKLWVQNLRQQMNNLGVWRKRRNALPNILLNPIS